MFSGFFGKKDTGEDRDLTEEEQMEVIDKSLPVKGVVNFRFKVTHTRPFCHGGTQPRAGPTRRTNSIGLSRGR